MNVEINIDENYIPSPSQVFLGNQGETNARTVVITAPEVSDADSYKLRLEYSDGKVYDLPLSDGKAIIGGSLLRLSGEVKMQWLATKSNDDNYELVAKSPIFLGVIEKSISDDTAPIPSYEMAKEAADKVLEIDETIMKALEAAPQIQLQVSTVEQYSKIAEQKAEYAWQAASRAENMKMSAESYARAAEEIADELTDAVEGIDEVKSSIADITTELDRLKNMSYVNLHFNDGYYASNGSIQEATSAKDKYSDKIEVFSGETFHIRVCNPNGNARSMMVFMSEFDEQERHIRRVTLLSASVSDEIMTYSVPDGVKKIAIIYRSYDTFSCDMYMDPTATIAQVNSSISELPVISENLSEAVEDIDILKQSTHLSLNFNDGYYAANGIIQEATSAKEKYSDKIDVFPGETFYIHVCNSVNTPRSMMIFVSEFNEQDKPVSRPTLYSASTSDVTLEYTVPENVRKISLSYRTYDTFTCDMYLDIHKTERNIYDSQLLSVQKKAFVRGINHRGYNKLAPENTLSAFRLSHKYGFGAVETDVQFTSDGQLVCIHDNTVDRTTNGTGNVEEMTLAQIRALDAGSWFSSDYSGEKVPTFEQVLNLCKKLGLHLYAEIKINKGLNEEQVQTIVDHVKKCGMIENVTFISFSFTALLWLVTYYPKARIGYVVGDFTDEIKANLKRLQTGQNQVFAAASVGGNYADHISYLVSNDIGLEIWTVNNTADILALDPYVTGVTSNLYDAGAVIIQGEG